MGRDNLDQNYYHSNAKELRKYSERFINAILIIIAAVFCIATLYYVNHIDDDWEWVEIKHKGLVVAKHEEQVSINRMGDFETEYHILLASGEMEDITEKEYMQLEVGDSIFWSTTERQLKEEKK